MRALTEELWDQIWKNDSDVNFVSHDRARGWARG